jgi:hypothetical protein
LTAKAAADEKRQYGPVVPALERRRVGHVEQTAGLLAKKSVPCPDPLLFHPSGFADGGGPVPREQSVVGRFSGQLS